MANCNLSSFLSVIVILNVASQGKAISIDEKDTILSFQQKESLDKFKEKVISFLPHEYMKADIFLLRWLRATDFNINQAENNLKANLQWRLENKMDTIDEEDWSEYELDYPVLSDIFDKYGRPTIVVNLGEWDIRRAVLTGKLKPVTRWVTKTFETLEKQVRDLQSQGKNITRWNYILNLDKFSAVQNVCLQCLPFYTSIAKAFEIDYPRQSNQLIFINSPLIFQTVLNLIQPIISAETREAIKIHGTNRDEWKQILFKDFERDQLPPELGGSRIN